MRAPAKKTPLWARVLIALFVGNGLAYAAYVRFRAQTGPAPARADVPELAETKISFASSPSGAKVSEQGVVLGVTPFIRNYPRSAPGTAREFTFELEGHSPGKVQAFLDQERIYVHTSLAPLPAPVERAATVQPVSEIREVVPQPPPSRAASRRAAQRREPVREQAREQPHGRERVAVTKLSADEREVPKLDEETSRVPKLDDARGVPKLDDDARGVPKLDDGRRGVPKLDEGRDALKLDEDDRSSRNVPKLKE